MQTRAVEKPKTMKNIGARNEYFCSLYCRSTMSPPLLSETSLVGMIIEASMEPRRKSAKMTTRTIRILAMNLYLRKNLRRVMRAAR